MCTVLRANCAEYIRIRMCSIYSVCLLPVHSGVSHSASMSLPAPLTTSLPAPFTTSSSVEEGNVGGSLAFARSKQAQHLDVLLQ